MEDVKDRGGRWPDYEPMLKQNLCLQYQSEKRPELDFRLRSSRSGPVQPVSTLRA